MEVMFAYDTNLFLYHKNTDTLFASINVKLENVSTWFKPKKLSLNVDKTKLISCSLKKAVTFTMEISPCIHKPFY